MPVKITAEKNVFADELLDTIGQEWAFDHTKGQNEWWKNAIDQYLRDSVAPEDSVVLVDLHEANPKRNSIFRVIDFGGMSVDAIQEAFKRWGDVTAAKRGAKGKKTFGGHGNGGKFYMRAAFETSRFVTYREGRLSVYGFDKQKRYGFQENYRDVEMDMGEALEFADIDVNDVPQVARDRLADSQGFTVVTGERPNNFQRGATAQKIFDKLCQHAQARRLVAHYPIFMRTRDGHWKRLHALDPTPRPDFDKPRRINVPKTLDDENGDQVVIRDATYPEAWIEISTSQDTLRGTGANRLDVVGELGVIGSHDISSLQLPNHPAQGDFIFGELYAPKLEDPDDKCVTNDRDKLIDNEKTRALLSWARDRIDELAAEIAEADAKERKQADLSQSSQFNELLNQWKNKFMPTLMAQMFGGPGEGSGFGGSGTGTGGSGDGDSPVGGDENDSDDGKNGGDQGGGGDEVKHGNRAPTVLLSDHDVDPLDLMAPPLSLSPRQPAVYQRPKDVDEGIYWINTSRPLAQRILDDFGSESTRWRDYMFQRYVEIILKESIHQLEQNEGGELTADRLQGHIDSLYTTVHDQAFADLEHFLFDEKLTD